MDASQVIELGRESLWVAVMVASPLLGVALATGLIIGIFQAATSIQEMTLSFIPVSYTHLTLPTKQAV